MTDFKLVYKSNQFKKCKKLICANNNSNKTRSPHYTLIVKFKDVDAKFFYGLVVLANESIQFEKSLIKLLIGVVYTYLNYSKKENSVINVTIDMKLLKNAIESIKIHRFEDRSIINNVKELNLVGVGLVARDEIIRTWSSIVLKWINMKRKYEGYWAYFSTLGGAYSSLGEDSYEMAKKAEQTSLKQLKLAKDFNDPNAISRCKLFLSFSFIQLAKYQEAKQILYAEYKYLTNENNKDITDERLRIMCIAGIKKLKYSMSKIVKANNTNG